MPRLLEALDSACGDVGRTTPITKSVEVLVRTLPDQNDAPPAERDIRGDPDALAAELRRFTDLGIDHLQVQLRPNSVAGVEAFAPVLDALRGARSVPSTERRSSEQPR